MGTISLKCKTYNSQGNHFKKFDQNLSSGFNICPSALGPSQLALGSRIAYKELIHKWVILFYFPKDTSWLLII